LVIPHDDLVAVLAAKGKYNSVPGPISRCFASSYLGKALFQAPRDLIAGAALADKVSSKLGAVVDSAFSK
jgi:hypothetical protein